jgi:glycine/D-amino acid oxidase-like deaminating enzyme
VPGGRGTWAGGVYTPSDGRAEPALAASAIAAAAIRQGAVVVETCAVRALSMSAGRVSGVITERGEIRCDQVLLAGGLWSRRLLGNHGVDLPTLPLICHAIRTAPMEGPTEIAVGGPDFSFRKRLDGGFTIAQRGAVSAPDARPSADRQALPARAEGPAPCDAHLAGQAFFQDLALARRWKPGAPLPSNGPA